VTLGIGLNGMWAAAAMYVTGAAITMTLKFRAGGWTKIVL
jgi:hypothetical protein